jgi:hypothetical protein
VAVARRPLDPLVHGHEQSVLAASSAGRAPRAPLPLLHEATHDAPTVELQYHVRWAGPGLVAPAFDLTATSLQATICTVTT